jgi:mono/diheme cytochrome c family protein
MKKIIIWAVGAAAIIAVLVLVLKVVFEDPHVAEGRAVYAHYCAGCHGETGRGNGFNAANLDPYPRDLTDSQESYMAEGSNDQIFSAIATGVAGSAPHMEGLTKHVHHHGGKGAGMEGMPGMEGMEGMDHDMAEAPPEEDHQHDHAADEGKAPAEAHNHDETAHTETAAPAAPAEEEPGGSPLMPYWGFTLSKLQLWDLVAYIRTLHKNDAPPIDFTKEISSTRIKPEVNQDIVFPSLDSAEGQSLVKEGKKLFDERYACAACHQVNGEGGEIGPSLDRSGIRLNPKWVYRWIQDPQSIRRDTKMPAFGLPDEQAKALTLYLMTLRAAAPPAQKENPATD